MTINFDILGKGRFKFLPPNAYIIEHPFILSDSEILQQLHYYLVVHSGNLDQVIKAVILIEAWREKNIVWLKVYDIQYNRVILYSQDLESEICDFLITSMLFHRECLSIARRCGGSIVIE